jgi:hypothetical protein
MRIQILHSGQPQREDELSTAIKDRIKRHTGGSTTVSFEDVSFDDADLIIYLGNAAAASDTAINQRLSKSIENKTRILPLVDRLEDYFIHTPESLHSINGEKWSSAPEIAELVLRQLGVTDRDRRVFLSYRRKESTPVALQLYEKLHQAGFLVFLDFFSIDRGIAIQERIAQALNEMSFVLLLETQGAAGSTWVAEEEIGYALNHRLGLLSLAWPGIEKAPAFPMIPPDRREQLVDGDMKDERLTDQTLVRVMLRIEREHADQLRERRERMITDVADLLKGQGYSTIRMGAHSLVVPAATSTHGAIPETVVRVCPRSTNHWDMFELGGECARRKKSTGKEAPHAWVVSTRGGYLENLELTQWIADIQTPKVSFFDPLDLPFAAPPPEQAAP